MHGDGLLPELQGAGRPDHLLVGPDSELRRRLAVAPAGTGILRVVVDRDQRVERLHLSVRAEEDRAFGMRAEAARIRLASHGERIPVNGLPRPDMLAHAAGRARKV